MVGEYPLTQNSPNNGAKYKDGTYIVKDGVIYKIDLKVKFPADGKTFQLPDFIKKTNADRIRAMSDEKLAEWISSIMECDDGCPCIKECGEKEELGFCYQSMLEWLRKECDGTVR